MVPWATDVAHTCGFSDIGKCSFFDIEFYDILAFVFPLYGKGLPSAFAHIGQAVWLVVVFLWIWLFRSCRNINHRDNTVAKPKAHAQGAEGALVRWLEESGPYTNFNFSVSLYLLLTTSCVFLSGLYTVSDVRYRNSKSLFGALQKGPETSSCVGLRWFCALTAMGSSLLLARVGTLPIGARRAHLLQGVALLLHCCCFFVYFCVRWKAVKVVHDPHKSILAVDWSMFGISVALSMRGGGVPERICSCWLRKFVIVSLAFMYLNAGISKLKATGLVWFSGEILRQLIRDFRFTSAWPWLSDLIIQNPWTGLLLGLATFTWEVTLSIVVLLWEFPLSYLVVTQQAGSCMRRFGRLVRLLWVIVAMSIHFGIFLLVYPPFTTFVHALAALVLDPFAYFGVTRTKIPAAGVERRIDQDDVCEPFPSTRTECNIEAGSCVSRRVGATPQLTTPTERLAEIVSDEAEKDLQKEASAWAPQPGLWLSTILLLLCGLCWIYVGFKYTNIDHHPFLPFSSFSMYSTYAHARRLKYPGRWDQAA